MSTRGARACSIPGCPAFVADGADRCVVHVTAERVTAITVGRYCRRCNRPVVKGAWIKADSIAGDSCEHVTCRPRAQKAEES